jgi:hypothetical protein
VALSLTETIMRISRVVLFLGVVCLAGAAGAHAQTIGCSSDDGHRHYCKGDTRNGVTLTRQTSGAACQEGYSWGYDEGGIWVDHGCRAYFTLQGPGRRVGGDWGGHAVVRCSSDDWARHYCQADTGGDVELLKQHSQADCIQGISWGFDPNGIWVDRGCRAEFLVEPNEQPQFAGPASGQGQALYCASDDGRKNRCDADTRGGVQMVKQRSGAACQQGYSWGYDDRGIWVDHGCRADFVAYSVSDREGWERHGRACRTTIGEDRAREMVEQCRHVSPGTHPPCNADNSCRALTEEIRRSCLLLGPDAPQFCNEYW